MFTRVPFRRISTRRRVRRSITPALQRWRTSIRASLADRHCRILTSSAGKWVRRRLRDADC